MELSVVIPALNEEKTIAICIEKALSVIGELGVEGEVIVADNGSTDNTVQIAEDLGARIVHVPEKGYGSALMAGFQAASGEYLVMGDADDSYNFEEILVFVSKLREGYDFVIGNRFSGKIAKGAMPFLHRYLGTPVLTWIMNIFFKTGIGDTNCGMRALTKKAFNQMRLKTGGMEFATEMVIKASILKLKISEVPCNLYKDKRDHPPHLNTWRDGWRHLRFMLLFTPSWTFQVPGVTLLSIGFAGMIILFLRDVFSPLAIALITQKHMLSFMLLSLLGFQIMSLGLAAQAFSFSQYFDHNNKSMNFLNKYFSLERGVLCGGAFILVAVCSFLYLAFSYMGFLPFLTDTIRFDIAIFAITFFMIGVQLVYTSFLLSLFYLKIK